MKKNLGLIAVKLVERYLFFVGGEWFWGGVHQVGVCITWWSTLLVTKELDSKAKDINIAIIDADAYCEAYYLKKAQVFIVLRRDIQYQAEKKARAKTDPKNFLSHEYHNFLNIFLKKNSETLSPNQMYDHKIHLEDEQKPGHLPLYKISFKELDVVKRYHDFYSAKKFIQASLASYSFLVLFVKKQGGEILFYINYKKLNTIMKKDYYLIPLIKKTLA